MDENVSKIIDKVKALVKEGNVNKIRVTKDGETVLTIPVNVGLIGAVVGLYAAPFIVLASAIAAYGTKCKIEIVKKDGTVEEVRDAAAEAAAETGQVFSQAKDAIKEAVEKAKEAKAAAEEEATEDSAEETVEEAAEEAEEAVEEVVEEAEEAAEEAVEEVKDIIEE